MISRWYRIRQGDWDFGWIGWVYVYSFIFSVLMLVIYLFGSIYYRLS